MNYFYGISYDIPKHDGGATGFEAFNDGYVISFADTLQIYNRELALVGQIEHIKRRTRSYITCMAVSDRLYVGYSDGYLCEYQLPDGLLRKQCVLPFRVLGVFHDCSDERLLVWGNCCELWVLNDKSLDKIAHIVSLRDWPIAMPLVDGKILAGTKSGLNEYQVHVDGPQMSIAVVDHSSTGLDGIFKEHGIENEPVVDMKQVGEFSWVLAQKSGWILLRWQSGKLVQEISSGATNKIRQVVTSGVQDCFGILQSDDKLVWVSNGQVVPVDPAWTKDASLIGITYRNGSLLALVEDQNLKFYSCDLTSSFEWTPMCRYKHTESPSTLDSNKIIKRQTLERPNT